MTIEEIIEELGEPVWNTAQFKDSKESSFYLYELCEMHNFGESKLWIFNVYLYFKILPLP